MEIIGQGIVAVGWLAIASLVLVLVVAGLREHMDDRRELPFFGLLEQQGMTVNQAVEAVGIDSLARAVRRCAFCASKAGCGANSCPNEPLLQRAKNRQHAA
jgi:predicted Kef-type K+ transport protein